MLAPAWPRPSTAISRERSAGFMMQVSGGCAALADFVVAKSGSWWSSPSPISRFARRSESRRQRLAGGVVAVLAERRPGLAECGALHRVRVLAVAQIVARDVAVA